jgi:hypothetical protein
MAPAGEATRWENVVDVSHALPRLQLLGLGIGFKRSRAMRLPKPSIVIIMTLPTC